MNRTVERVIKGAAEGTTLMTLYSYAVSEAKGKTFMEPDLLAMLLKRLLPQQGARASQVEGWLLHYLTGLGFTSAFHYATTKRGRKPSYANGILFGAISGLIGVGIWKMVVKTHPNPPLIDYNRYYFHLIAAHIVFGIFAAEGYNHLRKN